MSGGRGDFRLARGARVAVVATGFAVRRRDLALGLRALETMGYEPVPGEHVLERDGYLAGTDEARASDLVAALCDDAIDAIWFARGGYGTARILDRVPWRRLRRGVKPMIGYSDLTALFAPVVRRTGRTVLYGPVVTELADAASHHAASLRSLLAGREVVWRPGARQIRRAGRARGRLVGGNLSVLAHLCGTRHAPEFRDAVLFLEDVGEPVYRIDRALEQLRAAGAFRRAAGVICGRIDCAPRRRFPPDRSLERVLDDALREVHGPIVEGFPAGHVARKWSVPLGGTVVVDTSARRVRFVP